MTHLWINNALCELNDGTKIRHTFQVNDISDVKDRQTSRTNSFELPKTPRNIRIFEGLGLPSDSSPIPYRRLSCQMKLDGFDLIVKGWANVSETAETYKVSVYSGIISFFKAIENKTIGKDLDLSEINHEKSLAAVIASQANPNYRYLLADYNGKTHYGENDSIVNIDYMVPSAAVQYLWNKVFDKYGFAFLGSIFEDEDFLNLWLTYPKGILDETLIELDHRIGVNSFTNSSPYTHAIGYFGSPVTVTNSGKYRIKLDLTISGPSSISLSGTPILVQIYRNSAMTEEFSLYNNGLHHLETDINFNTDDQISFRWEWPQTGTYTVNINYDVTTSYIENYNYSFSEELKDFAITDFVKEVLNRFGLTMFPSEFSNDIEFLTISERINYPVVMDWSDKFIERRSETYVYETYAKQNQFIFQYNDKESSYANSSVFIDNQNLPESKTAFASKTYAAEKDFVPFLLGEDTINVNVFKIYEKEIQEKNGIYIKYKGLDKRWHFISARPITSIFQIGSERMGGIQTVTSFSVGEVRQNWSDLLKKYYSGFRAIISNSRLHSVDLNLELADVLHLDFQPRYYFAQEQQYYLLNKLIFDGKSTIGEFVRISKGAEEFEPPEPQEPTYVLISWLDGTNYNRQGTETTQDIKLLQAGTDAANPFTSFEWQRLNFNWDGLGTDISPYTATLLDGENRFRMKATTAAGAFYSNELKYTKIILPPCKAFVFGYVGVNPSDTGAVVFRDCDDVQRTYYLTWDESGGNYYEITICAIEIISNNEFAMDMTDYGNQQNC